MPSPLPIDRRTGIRLQRLGTGSSHPRYGVGISETIEDMVVRNVMRPDGTHTLTPRMVVSDPGGGGRVPAHVVDSWGTLVLVLLLGTGSVGLLLAGAPLWSPQVLPGVVLIAAVSLAVAQGCRRVGAA